ncbi:MAG: hypothetical protein HYX47_11115 [Burkholderiales bacterium]|nr:hypothetical protein [Burkholderiales bacterium]
MFSTPQSALSPVQAPPVIDTTARWLSEQDELALGCECADPALQIERWQYEAAQGQGAQA